MEEIQVIIEIEGELEQGDRFGIEDIVADALREMGVKVIKVKVIF